MSPSRRRHRPGTIERAVIAATKADAAPWLTDADAAAVWALRDLAEGLDILRRRTGTLDLDGLEGPDADDLELRGQLAGRLLRGADALGLTPYGRGRLDDTGGSDGADLGELLSFDAAG